MVLLDSAGLAITSIETVITLLVAWKRRRNAHEEISRLLEESQKAILRIRTMVEKYGSTSGKISSAGQAAFKKVAHEVDAIRLELETLESKLNTSSSLGKFLSSESSVTTLSSMLSRLFPLERHLDIVVLMMVAKGELDDLARNITAKMKNGVDLGEEDSRCGVQETEEPRP